MQKARGLVTETLVHPASSLVVGPIVVVVWCQFHWHPRRWEAFGSAPCRERLVQRGRAEPQQAPPRTWCCARLLLPVGQNGVDAARRLDRAGGGDGDVAEEPLETCPGFGR